MLRLFFIFFFQIQLSLPGGSSGSHWVLRRPIISALWSNRSRTHEGCVLRFIVLFEITELWYYVTSRLLKWQHWRLLFGAAGRLVTGNIWWKKNTHKKWTRFPSLSLKGENRRVSNFFFQIGGGGGVATLSIPQLPLVLSTLRNPLSFSLDTVVDESPSASRKSPRVRHLIRYIHTHNTVWKRGGASSQQTCSFRPPSTNNNNIEKKYYLNLTISFRIYLNCLSFKRIGVQLFDNLSPSTSRNKKWGGKNILLLKKKMVSKKRVWNSLGWWHVSLSDRVSLVVVKPLKKRRVGGLKEWREKE